MARHMLYAFIVSVVVSGTLTLAQEQTIRRAANLPEPVGEEQRVQASELDARLADANVVLLDVREGWELEKFGTREGYLHIPLAELEDRLDELPEGENYSHCLKRRWTGRACRGLVDQARLRIGWFLRAA